MHDAGSRSGLASAPSAHLTQPKYRRDIDGLRALGVLLVVAFHAFPKALPGGFVGVDIFFVVSGYLISTIIFGNLENNSFSFGEFYARRIRRIFPALAVVLATGWAGGWFILLADEHRDLGLHIVGGAGFVANLVLWSEAGYFDSNAYSKPFLHLWSLGIEEQFYILWPLLLAFVRQRQYNFLAITLLVAIASLAAGVLTIDADPVAAFYSPWSRFWELMVGGILAYLALHKPRCLVINPNGQAAVGLALILLAVALLNKNSAFPGWWALLPTIGTFLLISAGSNAWLNRNFLSSRGMVGIGLISYPLYLWHWLLLSFAWIVNGRMPPSGTRMVLVLISFLLAFLTYFFLERRIRAGGKRTALALLAVMIALILIGLASYWQMIRPRNDDRGIQPILEALRDWEYPLGFQKTDFKGTQVNAIKAGEKTVLFIGDSHLEQYGPRVVSVLANDARHYRSALFLTSAGCSPIPGSGQTNKYHGDRCLDFRQQVERLVLDPEISAVVIGAAWNLYFLKSSSQYSDSLDLEFELRLLDRFIRTIAARKKVFLVLDNPSGVQFEPRNFFAGSRLTDLTVTSFRRQVPLAGDQAMLAARLAQLATAAGATVIDPVLHLCSAKDCPVMTAAGKPIYKDDNHYRPFYVREHAMFIDVALTD